MLCYMVSIMVFIMVSIMVFIVEFIVEFIMLFIMVAYPDSLFLPRGCGTLLHAPEGTKVLFWSCQARISKPDEGQR